MSDIAIFLNENPEMLPLLILGLMVAIVSYILFLLFLDNKIKNKKVKNIDPIMIFTVGCVFGTYCFCSFISSDYLNSKSKIAQDVEIKILNDNQY